MFAQTIHNQKLIWQTDYPMPEIQPHEVLIKVAYAGVNRADLFQVQGKYPAPEGASPLPGLEVSGEIVALGDSVISHQSSVVSAGAAQEQLKIGQKICALLEGGGYAEYVAVAASQVMPVPEGWSMAEAAALPETLITNWFALVETARLQSGESLLIHSGASGIGSFAISLAKLLGAKVTVTVGSEEKAAFCMARGADGAILREEFLEDSGFGIRDSGAASRPPALVAEGVRLIAEVSRPKQEQLKKSYDVILDIVGGDYMQKNLKLLKRGGRLVQLAFLRGAKAELNLAPLLLNNLSWHGITLRSQSRERKAALVQNALAHCAQWLADRQLAVPLFAEFPLQEAEKAHAAMQQNLNSGKIVLKVAA